ncbi:DEAD/DEAH box helicase [Haloimpatiens sp. FM7315]|uniref:DEAD/DEAH box helicase n=1 Tax=Haloimpatiens sp. FM7315 TaxID=3298609 RepID=UPI00370B1ED5
MKKILFNELNLSEEINKAVSDMGFEETTPIQAKAIPCILEGMDVIGQAQTGTGKTAAVGIPILEKIDCDSNKLQAIVLCPTRELAVQFAEEMSRLAKYKKGLRVLPIYGGQSMERQISALKRGVQVVIGTPGRVMDHMRRRTLKMDHIKIVALDEADEMLNMGFIEDIETILKEVPEERQTVLFSATMPKAIMDITKRYQKNPKVIKVVKKELSVSNIQQKYFEVKEKNKTEVLTRLLHLYDPKLSVVFCNTKKKVDELVVELQSRGFFADAIHGDLKQNQRDKVMGKFRKGIIQILVATDVAARGIDVDDVEAVFNYDLPQFDEYYVHRIGRTGRAGRSGIAVTFASGKGIQKLREIERYIKMKVAKEKVPSKEDIDKIKMDNFIESVKETINEGELENYYTPLKVLAKEGFKESTIAAALLKMCIEYKDKKPEEVQVTAEEELENTGAEVGMVRLFMNVGRKHKAETRDFVGTIAREADIRGKEIGKIDIYDKYSFVEVPKELGRKVITAMDGNSIKGFKVSVEPANKR